MRKMILNRWVVRFWRGPLARNGPDLDTARLFYPHGADVARPGTGCCGWWVKSEGKSLGRQAVAVGPRDGARGTRVLAPAFVYCAARGRRRGSAADVTRRAH